MTKPFAVAFGGQTQTPIRFQSDGTIIMAAPLNIDMNAGTTAALSTTLTISQNGSTASSPIQINDLPQLSDLGGLPPGTISRAFLIYQAISLGRSINIQQAISLLPKAGNPNNATLLANLKNQLLNVIKARNDIDRIMTNNSLSIPIGTGPGELPLSFDINSITIMDRVVAQSLLTSTSNGTVLPEVKNAPSLKTKRKHKSIKLEPLVSTNTTAFWNALTTAIGTDSSAIAFLSNQQTLADKDSSFFDQYLSNLSAYSGYLTLGATVVGLAATAASLPVVAGVAGAVATGATIAGLLAGSASIGNDVYNICTNVSGLSNGSKTVADVGKSVTSLVVDGLTTYLAAEGMGGENGVLTGAGEAFNSVFTQLYTATADGTTLAYAGLLASTGNLLVQTALSADSESANTSIQSVSTADFGGVTGIVSVANSQGPILSGLTGVGAGDFNGTVPDTLTSIAGADGSYNLILPIGSPDLTYNAMDVVAFDPVDLYDSTIDTFTVLGTIPAPVDLSGVNPNTPIVGPSFVGACNDTDAGSPDGDDPDCD